MKKSLLLLLGLSALTTVHAQDNRVGVNTTNPRAGLDINHVDGFLATGELDNGYIDNLPLTGPRLMWIPQKGAFRVGGTNTGYWSSFYLGKYSVAMGYNTVAAGDHSTALGSRIRVDGTGSFAIGDASVSESSAPIPLTDDNRFYVRFAKGYVLFTSSNLSTSASLPAGATSWSTASDSSKKEGFRPADGALFLQKIAGMRLGSWNYKGQDARTMRHYGPMAQDFFAAFGRDGVGTIGCDTLINQADFDGVNLIAIQALVRENETLKARLERLEAENKRLTTLEHQSALLRADVESLKRLQVANTGR